MLAGGGGGALAMATALAFVSFTVKATREGLSWLSHRANGWLAGWPMS